MFEKRLVFDDGWVILTALMGALFGRIIAHIGSFTSAKQNCRNVGKIAIAPVLAPPGRSRFCPDTEQTRVCILLVRAKPNTNGSNALRESSRKPAVSAHLAHLCFIYHTLNQ